MTAPVTPETLTDEMIRGLLIEITSGLLSSDDRLRDDCRWALARLVPWQNQVAARQRICDAINARRAKET